MSTASIPKRSSSCPLTVTRKLKLSDGIYEGDIKDNIPHGFGTLKHRDGYLYYGLFLSGKFTRGKKIGQSCHWEGEWENFQLKSGSQHNDDGSVVSGSWINGKLEGPTITTFPNGNKLHCHYKYGISLGFAKLEYKNGNVLTGVVIDNKFHGHCQLKENNSVINCFYENGRQI